MTKERITASGHDAEQFGKIREEIAEYRGGNEPSNAEVLRRLMESWERGGSRR